MQIETGVIVDHSLNINSRSSLRSLDVPAGTAQLKAHIHYDQFFSSDSG